MKKDKFIPDIPSAEWFAQAFHDVYCHIEDVGKDFRTAREREPFKSLLNTPGASRNSKVLESFVAYCQTNPQLRFWQALRSWSGVNFIYASDKLIGFEPLTVVAKSLVDTFSWEGRNG